MNRKLKIPLLLGGKKKTAVPWYLAGNIDATKVLGAWQGIGALNLAASYVNLASPGTNDLTASGAGILWSADNGWSNQGAYLETGISATSRPFTIIARVKGWGGGGLVFNASGSGCSWSCQLNGDPTACHFGDDGGTYAGKGIVDGIGAIAYETTTNRGKGYVNGELIVSTLTAWGGTLRIVPNYSYGAVSAVAVYNFGLSAAQIAAIGTAMMALP